MNAIERLRKTLDFLFTYHDKEPYQKVMADVAAVDALYQAAKDAEAEGSSPQGMTEETHRALAAAVRRVDGEA